MNAPYALRDLSAIYSPGLLFFKDLIEQNIARAVRMAGDPSRLRPHMKTHKTREVARLELDAGITKHKCATLAEAETLADCGAADVLLAYNLVGPNCGRMARLARRFPKCDFSVLADHPAAVDELSAAMVAGGETVDVLIDLNVGQNRTGIVPGDAALDLYRRIAQAPGLRAGGFHVYDGHNHQESPADRNRAVRELLEPVLRLRERAEAEGLPVPRLVTGGTPTYPVYAGMDLPGMECSPGTCVLHDHNYRSRFADLAGFVPAALLLTRVISRPTPTRVTFDLGYKAVASDPPAGKRCVLLDVPSHEAVLQNEEHLVIETAEADRFRPGDAVLAVPAHVCPTVALHRFAYVVEQGEVTGRWEIAARDRELSV
jgi:D-threonine aldolase